MSAELLQSVGQSLYGLQWQTDLARALNRSDRTIRNWSSGSAIPPAAWRDIETLCRDRVTALYGVLERVSRER